MKITIDTDSIGKGLVFIGQSAFCLLVGSCILMAFYLAFAMLFEIIFKVKLI